MGRSTRSICSALLALSTFTASTLGQAVTGQLGNAIENLKNPTGAAYIAVLNGPSIKGRIIALDAQEKGTEFSVMFTGLPQGGPFGYHLHVMPVEADGNCTKTLAHLDPFIRGEVTPCMKERPETCQVGDLSGKHEPMKPAGPNNEFVASYMDPYVSLTPGMGAFFGNRSFVIHMPDKTRIACANFLPADQALAGMAGMPPAMMPPPGMLPAPPVAPNGGNQGAQAPGTPAAPGTPPAAAPPAAPGAPAPGTPGAGAGAGAGTVPPAGGVAPGTPGTPQQPGVPVPGAPEVPIPVPGAPLPDMPVPVPIPGVPQQPQGQRGERGGGRRGQGRGGNGRGREGGGRGNGQGGQGGGFQGQGGQGGSIGILGLDANEQADAAPAAAPAPAAKIMIPGADFVNGGPKGQSAAGFPAAQIPQGGQGGQGQGQGGEQGGAAGGVIHQGASSRTTSVSISALAAVFFIAAFAL